MKPLAGASSPYPVYVGSGITSRLPSLLAALGDERRVALVTDRRLIRTHARGVVAALERGGFKVAAHALPAGEAGKSLAALRAVYDFLVRNRIERRTPLVAVGGGSVGDAAGFAAATFYRGLPLVHVPTTLLAQADSSIGGKTAVDHPRAKNAIGAFHEPALVAADVSLLATLPDRDYSAGLTEVVKVALVFDPGFCRWLDRHWQQLVARESKQVSAMIRRSVRLKLAAVAGDVRDLAGSRELLNFGHTLGHALEAASAYRLRHGEAVAWGLRAALDLSERRGLLASYADHDLAWRLVSRLPARSLPRSLTVTAVIAQLMHDKKRRRGQPIFVLLRRLGQATRAGDVSRGEIRQSLASLGLD